MKIEKIADLDARFLRYLNWDFQHLSNERHTSLEIGFGNGEFLVNSARHFKDRFFIGIESSKKYFLKALKKADTYQIKNLCLMNTDAENCVFMMFPDRYFDEIYIHFPDPWFKNSHKRRRLIDEDFSEALKLVLKDTGRLIFVSDYFEYFQNSVFILTNCGFSETHNSNNPYDDRLFKTKYEKQFILQSKKIFYAVLKKS